MECKLIARGPRRAGAARRSWRALLFAAVAAACGVFAATASAHKVMIVSQGEAPAKVPAKVLYFKTIQAAVNATREGDWVLIAPGVYYEEVKVTRPHTHIWIRGMDRNTVILDGKNEPKPEGSNGIEVYKDPNVWIENITVRNFDRATADGPGGNEIWWNGGADSNKLGGHGWWGRYLTAYDTGLDGGYGIFTNNMKEGAWEDIYASGFNDSGMYLGACPECEAHINKAVMENNALGYSGSNSGGNLVIENSVFNHNTNGIAPNSENPGDGPPPQNGACEHRPLHWSPEKQMFVGKLPTFSSTAIGRCTIIRNNRVEENDNLSAPANPSSEKAPWGTGIQLPGDYADLVEGNLIKNNPTNGVLGFEYPNPYPPTAQTLYFELAGNKIANNTFVGNGSTGGTFAGDVMLQGGLFRNNNTQNCLSGNSFTAATYPANIEETWGCQNATTPNPQNGFAAVEYLLELQYVSEHREAVGQPAPPPQQTMPNPCEGVPVPNALCP
ncbi:MAG TPA: hypothetical protein VHY83_14860 [Solirubrobacteraceae bacterium]|nr:hypothetical protein [Solirubrobacteraceae bacterium]